MMSMPWLSLGTGQTHSNHHTGKSINRSFSFAGCHRTRHRCARNRPGRSLLATASHCRIRASRGSHRPCGMFRPFGNVPRTDRNRIHPHVGGQTHSVSSAQFGRPVEKSIFNSLSFDCRISQGDHKKYLKGVDDGNLFAAGTLEEKASELQRKFEALLAADEELHQSACKGECLSTSSSSSPLVHYRITIDGVANGQAILCKKCLE